MSSLLRVISTPFLLSISLSSTYALPAVQDKRSVNGPVISTNFQDPSILHVGGTWYAFSGPNGNPANINVQMATSSDFATWTLATGLDVMPTLGAWAATPAHLWSPDVNQLSSGEFVLYYSADVLGSPHFHCVGAAVASSISGPYTALDIPLACDLTIGGAIDPEGFHDPLSNTQWLLYKVDGNSLGHGGACANTVTPIVPTPILIQQVDSNDGTTPIGAAYEILVNDGSDGPDIEAPSLVYMASTGTYTLFYSAGCFVDSEYKIMYATSSSLTGPYAKNSEPLLVTSDTAADVYIPGGIDVTKDGSRAVFHADLNMGWFYGDGSLRVRGLFAASLSQIESSPPTVRVEGLY